MILADSSALVADLREGRQRLRETLSARFPGRERVIATPSLLEILAGGINEPHWRELTAYLGAWKWVDIGREDWIQAGRIFYELRRRGVTVRSKLDCCVAQAAIARGATLLHRDRDFEKIADIRPLSQEWLG